MGPIVGRDAELAVLRETLADAREGRGGIVLLVGEPGIGKSRLAEEVARLAAADMAVAWGRAWEAGGAPPYWPWTQVLRTIDGPPVSPQVARLRGDSGAPSPAAADDRFLLFDAATRYLLAAASTRPIAIILEDLHAADESSLHLLAFIATQLNNAPLVVLGSYRDVEARLTASAGAILDRVARHARVIHPHRLRCEDVIAIASADPTLALDRDAVVAVHRRSEGNPLFVVELLRVIGRHGVQATVPASVRTAIREHLHGLPSALSVVLEPAAVIGRELTTPVVAEVCGRPVAEVADALASAVELGVLVERGSARFAFAHGLIAETLHDDLPAARRAALHLAVADVLERESSPPLTEIAHHLLDAGSDHAERAAEMVRQAAERARRQLAFEPAAALIERGLAALPAANKQLRFELLRLLAEVLILGSEDERGKAAAREAADIGRALGSPELIARAGQTYGLAYMFGYTDQVLVELLEEALATLPPGDSALRARMLARLAAALTPAADSGPPMSIAREAIEMARRLGDERTKLDVIHSAMSALVPFAVPSERMALSQEALRLAERFDEPVLALRAHHRLVFDHLELADLAGAEAHQGEYATVAERLRLPIARWPSAMFRAMRALLQGKLAEHAAALDEATALAAAAGDTFFEKHALIGHRLVVARIVGDDELLAREAVRFATYAESRQVTHRSKITAGIHARLGELDAARAAAYPELADDTLGHRLAALASLTVEAIWELGDKEMAARLYPWLSAEDPPLAAFHMHGFAIERPTAHIAMQLAATVDDLEAARRHFNSASTLLRSVDARPLEVWLQLDFARILIAAGNRGDEPRCLLASARALNDALGMRIAPRIAAAEALLAAQPAAPPHTVTAAEVLVTLRCEGDYWLVEGCGASCRIKSTKGVELLARLVGEPNREIHVLDLLGAEGVDAGDAGEVIDKDARAAYRKRVIELRDALDEAESWHDAARVERMRDELEALEAELVRAAGLGGRERRVGRAAERARINVQRRLADALKRIAEVDAGLGKHLSSAIRTGVYCSYAPERAARARS